MSLLAEYDAHKAERARPSCKVCGLGEETVAFVETLIDRGEPLTHVARFLTSKGMSVSDHTIRSHRDRCRG